MNVAGIDYSTRAVDLVLIPYDATTPPQWHRFPLTGTDAFDRTRSVADAMPGRHSIFWDECLAVGIEHPGGHHGTRDMLRVQGAILSMLPPRLLVQPWPPARWRKAVGLAGNASKAAVREHVDAANRMDLGEWRRGATVSWNRDTWNWPQDACDAWCLAVATRDAIRTEQAA